MIFKYEYRYYAFDGKYIYKEFNNDNNKILNNHAITNYN